MMPPLRFNRDEVDWWYAAPLDVMTSGGASVVVEYDANDGLRTVSGRLRMATEHGLLVEQLEESGVGSATWVVTSAVVAVSCLFIVEEPDAPTDHR